jgi:hypothetical protein
MVKSLSNLSNVEPTPTGFFADTPNTIETAKTPDNTGDSTDFFDGEDCSKLPNPVQTDGAPHSESHSAAPQGSQTALEILETQIYFIPLGDVEHLAHVVGRLKALKARVRELDRAFNEKLLERIDDHGPVEVGEVRYYAGFERETLSRDTASTLTALFDAAGGELLVVADALCSQPFKPSVCKNLLDPDVYAHLFQTVEKKKAKEGKPVRKVLAANLQFSK